MTFTFLVSIITTTPRKLTYTILVEHDSGESSDDLSTTGINPTATLAQVHSELEQFTRNNTTGNSCNSVYLDPIPGPSNTSYTVPQALNSETQALHNLPGPRPITNCSNPVRSQSARLITTETLEHMGNSNLFIYLNFNTKYRSSKLHIYQFQIFLIYNKK